MNVSEYIKNYIKDYIDGCDVLSIIPYSTIIDEEKQTIKIQFADVSIYDIKRIFGLFSKYIHNVSVYANTTKYIVKDNNISINNIYIFLEYTETDDFGVQAIYKRQFTFNKR